MFLVYKARLLNAMSPSGVDTVSLFLTQWGSSAHRCFPAMAAVVATMLTAAGAVMTTMIRAMMTAATATKFTTAVPAVNITAVFTVRVTDAAWKQI